MKQKQISPLFGLLAVLTLLAGLAPATTRAQNDERCFAETGYCISGRIRSFWEQNGGLPVFGLPLGPQQEMMIDGQMIQAQWFERNRLELHPDNPPPYDVLLGRLGVDRLEQQGRNWRDFPPLDPNNADAERCAFFAETNHQVCDAFLEAFRSYGLNFTNTPGISYEESLALFGLPLSEPITEVIEGRELTVQWFERARFELHPDNPPPFNVLFGRLGAEVQGMAGDTGGAPAALREQSWQLTLFGPVDAPRPAVAEPPATLNFEAERVSGSTGCNSFGGPYTASAENINFGTLASTLALCTSDDLTAQEQAIFAALQGSRSYSLDGDRLRISYDEGRQALVYQAVVAPLQRQPWRLEFYGPRDVPRPNVNGTAATLLTFEAERLFGYTGCNNFNGGYQASATSISFEPLATTLALCTDDLLQRQEDAIFAALQDTRPYTIDGGTLTISYDEGRQELIYRAQNAAPLELVDGTITYLPRIALTPEAEIQVQLVDVSRADAPATVIAETTFRANGRQVPFAFALPYDPSRIQPNNSYAIQVRITEDGQLRFITTRAYLVITRGNPSTVEIIVDPA